MGIFKDFKKKRNKGNELIFEQNFLPFKRFFALDNSTYQDGAIPEKYKELMGLSCSLLLRCNDCVLYHLANCHKCGCSKEEITEAMNISLVIGGSIIIPHLRFAYQALEEINELDEI
jgi:AhpD family alkylhydroperoxidase